MSLIPQTIQASLRRAYVLTPLSTPCIPASAPVACPALTAARRFRGEVLGSRPNPRIMKTVLVGEPAENPEGKTKEMLPYLVKRTAKSGWLPVYREYSKGGTQITTIIRRIEGDIQSLAADLRQFVPADRVIVKDLQKHVVLRGDYLYAVRDWLTARRF